MPVVTGSVVGGARVGSAGGQPRLGTAVPDERSSRFSFSRVSYSGVADFVSPVKWTIVQTADGELWMIGGIWPIGPGETVYIGGGGPDTRIEAASTPVPAGVVKKLRFSADVPPGVGQTYTYTVMKNGAATACTVQITGNQRKAKSDVEVVCQDEDELCVRIQTSPGAPQANHKGTLQYAPAI